MCCAIYYHLHNLKNVKNIHGRGLLLVKLQDLAYCTNGTKLYKWYQTAQNITYVSIY